MKRVHVIGRKNSGKTSLVVDLVGYLNSQGVRVGTIKHTHHQHELDTPGKDSHRHRQAGAAAVGILSPAVSAVFLPAQAPDDLFRYQQMAPLFSDCCLVLVEGHSATSGPRVEVWRAATDQDPLAAEDPAILAVVTDDPVDVPVPVWPRADIVFLADQVRGIVGA